MNWRAKKSTAVAVLLLLLFATALLLACTTAMAFSQFSSDSGRDGKGQAKDGVESVADVNRRDALQAGAASDSSSPALAQLRQEDSLDPASLATDSYAPVPPPPQPSQAGAVSDLLSDSNPTSVPEIIIMEPSPQPTGSAEPLGPISSSSADLAPSSATAEPSATSQTPSSAAPSATPSADPSPTSNCPPSAPKVDEERKQSRTVFFILLVLIICTLCVYILIKTHFHYVPESLAVMFIGAMVGIITRFGGVDWKREERIDPTGFFLILLPPIIFESGYSLHKGNFFHNIGSITIFAVFGTILSALCIGAGIYLLGLAGVSYPLTSVESFAFGSLISAVDPVATIAIFNALDVDPTLNMLVFGESVLNDAVSIVLTNTVISFANDTISISLMFLAMGNFLLVALGSAAIGIAFGLASAKLLKHVHLRTKPSLEFSAVIIFAYSPYVLSEAIEMSGIMAILFCGIVMAHYTHFNLSPVTQMTTQQVFRTMAFLAETSVFAYLGLALFSFTELIFSPSLIVWSIVLCLIGRAFNIFPLSAIVNRFREVKITPKFQFIMWFSGLRGAIAFALSIHLPLTVFSPESRSALIATTLVIVLFTIILLGGSTMPLLKLIGGREDSFTYDAATRSRTKGVVISKTEEMDLTVDARDMEDTVANQARSWFERLDANFIVPFFRRALTRQEIDAAHQELQQITSQWYSAMREDSASTENASVTGDEDDGEQDPSLGDIGTGNHSNRSSKDTPRHRQPVHHSNRHLPKKAARPVVSPKLKTRVFGKQASSNPLYSSIYESDEEHAASSTESRLASSEGHGSEGVSVNRNPNHDE